MIDGEEGEPQVTAETEELTEAPAETGQNGTGEEETLELTADDETAEQPERKGKSVSERIDDLVAKQHEARREADYWRGVAEGRQPQAAEPEAIEAPARPDPASYEYGEADPRYVEDLTDWKVDTKLAAERQRNATEQTTRQLEQTYAQNVAAIRDELPDYDEKVTRGAAQGSWPCPPDIATLIKNSPVGPKVAYHLATNLDDAQVIAGLPPIQRAAAFGMIAAHVANQPKTTAKIATDAPEPAPARTKGGQFAPSGTLDDRQSVEEWTKRRNAQVSQP